MFLNVISSFEVAFYLLERAKKENRVVKPLKLQALLFLAQTYYAITYKEKFMPAVFVAHTDGPLEPNIFFALSCGLQNPNSVILISQKKKIYLDTIWKKFGSLSSEKLQNICKNTSAYNKASKRGECSEISFEEMHSSFSNKDSVPLSGNAGKSRFMRNQSGNPVQVTAWQPKAKK